MGDQNRFQNPLSSRISARIERNKVADLFLRAFDSRRTGAYSWLCEATPLTLSVRRFKQIEERHRMYPYLKLASTLIKAGFSPKLTLEEKSILTFRAGLTDIDPFIELNNARYFIYMELGRWDFSYRIGFLNLMRKNKWGVALGGSSVRFRRRIPFLRKFTLTTQLICHDGRWFYFLQETHLNGRICSSALMKMGVTSKSGLVPSTEVLKNIDRMDWGVEIPDWVDAWLKAESRRPWPEE
jgi:acyl-CoA thioesterase FadM